MSSKDEFIIKRSDSTTDIFRKWDEFITAAKVAKLIDIFNGKTSVKSDEEVEADNKSRLSYLKTALIKQTLIQEGIITTQIMQKIEANELYAYFYTTDIIAVDPNFPTEDEWVASRSGILYNLPLQVCRRRDSNRRSCERQSLHRIWFEQHSRSTWSSKR